MDWRDIGAMAIAVGAFGMVGHGTADGAEIVARSIGLHGGDVLSHSSVELEVCSRSGCYRIGARVHGEVFDLQASGEVRGHNRRVRITNESTELWQDDHRQVVEKDRVQSLRDWVMARVYFVFLPFRLQDESVRQEDLGIEIWNERPLRKVKISFARGSSSGADDEFLYWFDPDSGRLEQFAYSYSGDPGGLRFRRAFHYRRVGGILFYDQENWGVEGPGLTVDEITPEWVSGWDLVSTVELKDIRVATLEADGTGSP